VAHTYRNPLLPGADPFLLCRDGVYYLYGTNAPDGFRVHTSRDLTVWEDRGLCLTAGDGVIGAHGFWAPEILERGGHFYMVYVAEEHLAVAEADSPLGPFRQTKKEWLLPYRAIDGHFFTDGDGTVWLYYVRLGGGNVIWCARMTPDLHAVEEESARLLLRAETEWETRDCLVAEGPFVLRHGGKYYLTYSANHTRSPHYAVGCAVSDAPDGPFERVPYNPILHRTEAVDGPGHHSFALAADGRTLLCVYHTHEAPGRMGQRMTCIDRARFVPDPAAGYDRLVVDGPSVTPQPLPGEEI